MGKHGTGYMKLPHPFHPMPKLLDETLMVIQKYLKLWLLSLPTIRCTLFYRHMLSSCYQVFTKCMHLIGMAWHSMNPDLDIIWEFVKLCLWNLRGRSISNGCKCSTNTGWTNFRLVFHTFYTLRRTSVNRAGCLGLKGRWLLKCSRLSTSLLAKIETK